MTGTERPAAVCARCGMVIAYMLKTSGRADEPGFVWVHGGCEERGVNLRGARPVGGMLAGAGEGNAGNSPGEQRPPPTGANQFRALAAGGPPAGEVLGQRAADPVYHRDLEIPVGIDDPSRVRGRAGVAVQSSRSGGWSEHRVVAGKAGPHPIRGARV